MKNRNDKLDEFRDVCRRAGLRLTPQRLEIFSVLAESTDHPSVEELHGRLLMKFPTISLDTVYRTLGTLARHGLVHKIESAASHARYEAHGAPHHHLICRSCKEIVDFEWTSFDEAAFPDELKGWGRVEDRNVVVYGLCRKCEGKDELNIINTSKDRPLRLYTIYTPPEHPDETVHATKADTDAAEHHH